MLYAAIRHEPTRRYCVAPGKFRFYLQTTKDDMRNVWLFSRDKYMPLQRKDTRRILPMKNVACDGTRDYYEVEMELDVVCLRYCFKLEDAAGGAGVLQPRRLTREVPTDIEAMFDCPQILRQEERFVTPQWANSKIIYQIFPARFATHRNVLDEIWYQSPITKEANIGGSLSGITVKLPYIQELGADVIYLTPIFVPIPSTSTTPLTIARSTPALAPRRA